MKKNSLSFFKKKDLIFIAVILTIAAAVWLLTAQNARTTGTTAIVSIGYGDERRELTIPLEQGGIYPIDAALPVTLEVKDGAIRFIDSVCPDHRCESFGQLRHEGDWAACVPAGVSIQIKEDT